MAVPLPAETIPYVSTFIFVFAIVFGLLSYAKVFTEKGGNSDRRINGAIALSIALFSVLYQPLVIALTQYMPLAIAFLTPLFFIVFLKKVLEGKEGKPIDTLPLMASLILLGMLVFVFEEEIRRIIPIGIDPGTILWLGGIMVTLLFFWLVYKS